MLTACTERTDILEGTDPAGEDSRSPADLAVVWLSVSPPQAPIGLEIVSIDLIIANLGESPANRSTAAVRLLDQSETDVLEVSHGPTNVLGPGETQVILSHPLWLPPDLPDGTYDVVIELDIDSDVTQSNYANDRAAVPLTLLHPCPVKHAPVTFDDPELEQAIILQLGLEEESVTCEQLTGLRELHAADLGITSLRGLEQARELQSLNLWANEVSDLMPLAGLSNLYNLELSENQITDVSPLAELEALQFLGLAGNPIEEWPVTDGFLGLTSLQLQGSPIRDLSALTDHAHLLYVHFSQANESILETISSWRQLQSLGVEQSQIEHLDWLAHLTDLQDLNLNYNDITDLTPLAGLTELRAVAMSSNRVRDLTPLASLNNLRYVWLFDNLITDLSPLAENPGLAEEATIDVTANCLDLSAGSTASEQLEILLARGAVVYFEPQRDDCEVLE